tara:strand:- start:40 stop:1428 length:1389 start_codon:yes stop_codon:yes gene_type:complete
MFPLGFIIFPYLVKLILKKSYKDSIVLYFFYGFFYGFGFLVIYLLWIQNPFLVYEATSKYKFIAILLPIFISIFFGLSFCIYKFLKSSLIKIFITPLIFIIIEFIIANFIYGFPWISISYTLSNNLIGLYLIKFLGTLTSSYLLLSIFILPIFIFYKSKINKFHKRLAFVYSPFVLFLLAQFFMSHFNTLKLSKEISLEIHQLLIPINKADYQKIEDDIIYKIKNSKADYVIFAENNFPYLINKNNISNLEKYKKNNTKIIIGASKFESNNYYNSFLMLEDEKVKHFDKKILVPFGEFLPFRNYLSFMELISGTEDFRKGDQNRLIKTQDNFNILPVICYEVIFDHIYRNVNLNKIDIIFNITNDSWFGNKLGPYQHFYIARTKSLIANKPLIRVSNNGISAIIDNNGKILKSTELNQTRTLNYRLKIMETKSYLFYHKIFSYYLFFVIIFVLFLNRYFYNE